MTDQELRDLLYKVVRDCGPDDLNRMRIRAASGDVTACVVYARGEAARRLCDLITDMAGAEFTAETAAVPHRRAARRAKAPREFTAGPKKPTRDQLNDFILRYELILRKEDK